MAETRVHEMVARHRLLMADLFDTLTTPQAAQRSLCGEWTMHDILAHLTTFLRAAQPKIYVGMLISAGDIDRVNLVLTQRAARRSTPDLAAKLRQLAWSKITVPRAGYDPVLADLVLHELDVRLPLGIPGQVLEDRLWVTFNHLVSRPSPGFTMGSRLHGLRLVATDTGWVHGDGPVIEGPAESLVLAISGREPGLPALAGDGVPLLAERVITAQKAGPVERVGRMVNVFLRPPAAARRSRAAVAAVPTGPLQD